MAGKKTNKKKSSKKKAEPRKPVRRTAKASAKTAKTPSRAAKASSQAASKAKGKPAKSKPAKGKPAKKPSAQAKTLPPAKAKKASAAPRSRASTNGVHRRDRAGHLDPRYAAELRAKSREGKEESDERAFVGSRTGDDLAENLGEEVVEAMTTGEDEAADTLDKFADEEVGGPFVESSGNKEFAEGSDASNPADATREPFPKT
jgi:hypothetical protein